MKNHIVFKFIAIALCAFVLLTALLSGAGIAALVANDMYAGGLPDWRGERITYGADLLMEGLAGQYIVKTYYAGIPEFVLEESDLEYRLTRTLDYSGAQQLLTGVVYYTIHDENGNILLDATQGMTGSTLSLFTRFSTTQSFPYQKITSIVEDVESDSVPTTAPTETVEGVIEEESIQETVVSATIPQNYKRMLLVHNRASNTDYRVYCEDAETPVLQVTLYIYEPSIQFDPELAAAWTLMELLYENRINIIWCFAGSVLLFAVFAVYLCCAAGKKPGTKEIKPAGFNALPLDLYTVGAGGIIFILVLLMYRMVTWGGGFDLLDVGRITILACGAYAVCLVFVAFCFACAAQFKMPDAFWLRRSLFGMILILIFKTTNKIAHFLEEKLPPAAKKLWTGIHFLSSKLYHFTARVLKKLWVIGSFLCAELWKLLQKTTQFAGKHTMRFLHFVGHGIKRTAQMLPLTWQWLLVGIGLIFVLFITITSRSSGWILIGALLCLGIILYGANAFGILMEAAKRMSKGDLDTKVSDQFLLGSFETFAGYLNDLAGVAVIAAQKQMKSERMKTELITNVSHDIKTPLTSIINYVDLLQLPHSEEDEAQYLEVLGRKSQQLKKLIDDLMEMSKASTGNLSVDIRQVDAAEAVNQALGEFSDKLALGNLSTVFNKPEQPVLMKADGRLVWRVLSNILSNAVKYALPGTRLYIDLVQLEGKVLISVKNISREPLNVDAEELMERFVRGDVSRNTEGSGLGLNIAKSLMEVQHGKLQLLVDGDLFKVTLVFPGIDSAP